MAQYYATLKLGTVYSLPSKGLEFRKGAAPVVVDEQTKEYLEEYAVNEVTIRDGDDISVETRQKFTFELIKEVAKEDKPVTSRARTLKAERKM